MAGVDRILVDIAHEHYPIVEAVSRADGEAAAAVHANLSHSGRLLVHQHVRKLGLDLDGDQVWEGITSSYWTSTSIVQDASLDCRSGAHRAKAAPANFQRR
ncbi:hypothetical protein [Arthrobacter rhizosphaerae]|uniref:hypothetical protein n=1 Tax=Arthrobacter rhizosphaerae TaxID=2855490 RepID=UPI001FF6B5ED|nr:hypothetical protein [Arthrobacter rhizosphaerae]